MEKEKIIFIAIVLVLILSVAGILVYYQMNLPKDSMINNQDNDMLIDDNIDDDLLDEDGVVCAMDVLECSDGSYVPRIPPTCEFADCPNVSNASSDENDLFGLIDNFDSCVGAGFPILESFPEQCLTPDGRVFINE